MNILQLHSPLPLSTPKGLALCHLVINEGIEHDLQFVCFIDASGECWTFRGPEVRAVKNITMGRTLDGEALTPNEPELLLDAAKGMARKMPLKMWAEFFHWVNASGLEPKP